MQTHFQVFGLIPAALYLNEPFCTLLALTKAHVPKRISKYKTASSPIFWFFDFPILQVLLVLCAKSTLMHVSYYGNMLLHLTSTCESFS